VHLVGFITKKCLACLLTIKILITVIKITADVPQPGQLTKSGAGRLRNRLSMFSKGKGFLPLTKYRE